MCDELADRNSTNCHRIFPTAFKAAREATRAAGRQGGESGLLFSDLIKSINQLIEHRIPALCHVLGH